MESPHEVLVLEALIERIRNDIRAHFDDDDRVRVLPRPASGAEYLLVPRQYINLALAVADLMPLLNGLDNPNRVRFQATGPEPLSKEERARRMLIKSFGIVLREDLVDIRGVEEVLKLVITEVKSLTDGKDLFISEKSEILDRFSSMLRDELRQKVREIAPAATFIDDVKAGVDVDAENSGDALVLDRWRTNPARNNWDELDASSSGETRCELVTLYVSFGFFFAMAILLPMAPILSMTVSGGVASLVGVVGLVCASLGFILYGISNWLKSRLFKCSIFTTAAIFLAFAIILFLLMMTR
jgi:hypothetical protein